MGEVYSKVVKTTGAKINPAIEEKQDDIIAELQTLVVSGSIPTDLQGGGKIPVGITAVEVTFTGTTKSIIVSADVDNSGQLYVGKSNVTSAGANAIGFLEAGESISIDYEDATNAIFVVASVAAQNYWKGALK